MTPSRAEPEDRGSAALPAIAPRLVVAAQFGDRQALDALLRAVQLPLLRHVAYLVGSPEAAEDVVQDALLTVSRKLGELREPRWFRAWAFRIATRLAVRRARGARLYEHLALEEAGEVAAPDAPVPAFDDDVVEALRERLEQVPPASRLVLHMHYRTGLTHVEIAEALDVPVGTVKSRHHYGLQWLRARMQRAP